MDAPVCSVCSTFLEFLGGPASMFKPGAVVIGGDQAALEQWRGNVCLKCSYVFCPDCLAVHPPPKCPVCGDSAKPAMRGYLEGVHRRALVLADKITFEEEGLTVEHAQMHVETRVMTQTPAGFKVLGPVQVLSDGKDGAVEGTGETPEEALAAAERMVPPGVTIKWKGLVHEPKPCRFVVQDWSEGVAVAIAQGKSNQKIIVKSVEVNPTPRKGWWGIGKRPGTYTINAVEAARARIAYGRLAKVRITLAKFGA